MKISAIFLSAVLGCALWAQSSAVSQISGTVKDSTGLAVPDAQIRVTQTDTGLTRNAMSNTEGTYILPSLPIGPYKMEVSKQGFSTYVQSGIVLQVNTNPDIEVVLQVGAVSVQVQVEAAAAMVETHSTGVGQVVDQQRVVDLPLNGRNATDLIYLAGASDGRAGRRSGLREKLSRRSGAQHRRRAGQRHALYVGRRHAQRSVQQSQPPASLPRCVAGIQGGNQRPARAVWAAFRGRLLTPSPNPERNSFHGDAFEFVRNYEFNARNFFAPVARFAETQSVRRHRSADPSSMTSCSSSSAIRATSFDPIPARTSASFRPRQC